jgi:hypothetical protein
MNHEYREIIRALAGIRIRTRTDDEWSAGRGRLIGDK